MCIGPPEERSAPNYPRGRQRRLAQLEGTGLAGPPLAVKLGRGQETVATAAYINLFTLHQEEKNKNIRVSQSENHRSLGGVGTLVFESVQGSCAGRIGLTMSLRHSEAIVGYSSDQEALADLKNEDGQIADLQHSDESFGQKVISFFEKKKRLLLGRSHRQCRL